MTKRAYHFGAARYWADERYHAALIAFKARDLASAITEIEAAIALLPSHAEYFATLGFFCLEDKDTAAAKLHFERALELQPYEMLANYGRGMIAYRDKDWATSAADCFRNSLAAQPKRAETQYYLALVYHRLGRNDDATRWMTSAQKLFASAEDRREQYCQSWIREFQRLIRAE